MTTIASIAQRILDENGYSVYDFSGLTLTILEYRIDDAIDYLNLQAGLSVVDLAGAAESKSITATDGQILVVKSLTNLMLTAYKEKGTGIGVGGLSITYAMDNPDYKVSSMVIKNLIERLKEPPIVVSNDPLPNE